MEYKPIITGKIMIVELCKPLYGTFYGIWDKWVKIAEKRRLKMVVKTREGTATYNNAAEFLRGAKRFERFYKNPDCPMIFWGKDFLPDIKKREERKKIEKRVGETEGELLVEVLKKMKEKQPDLFEKIKSEFT